MRFALALAVVVAVASAAWANGRPPATNGVFFKPGDSQTILVRTTFGLLISHDDGCHFDWICEQNLGYGGPFDPKYAVATDGTIFATTFTGLRVSRDGGCSFTTATADLPMGDPGRIADVWIDALAIGPTGEVWVGTSESGQPNDVYRSIDNGQTFGKTGMQSPTIFWKSVKIAPADAKRVYITGYELVPPTAHFLTSTNGGTSWTPSPLANVMFGSTPVIYVVAVDPANADIVFMLSQAANPPSGDRLYRSSDGGATWTEALATTQPVSDVVIRDSQTVIVADAAGGSFVSATGGTSFQPMANAPQLACLAQRSDGQLIGCGTNWDPDYKAISRSQDAASWQKVFRFVELDGPLACPAGTPQHDVCDQQLWAGLREQFGATGSTCGVAPDTAGDPTPAPPKGCCDAGAAGPTSMLLGLGIGALLRRRRPSTRRHN